MTTERRHSEVRRMQNVISLRTDNPLLAQVRAYAEADGVLVSEWIRRAAALAVHERQQPATPPHLTLAGWSCQHLTMTSVPGVLGKVTSWCGCEMQPIYAVA